MLSENTTKTTVAMGSATVATTMATATTRSAYALLCYTRKPTRREEANNADIAMSMHLALRSPISGRWEPLNENYGIFFAAGVPGETVPQKARRACVAASRIVGEPLDEGAGPSAAIDADAVMPDRDLTLKSLRDPYIFRLSHGGFGIVATRTARGGEPDGSERSGFLLALSHDLTSFTQLGLVRVHTDSGVCQPSARFVESSGRYEFRWRDDAGQLWHGTVDDLREVAQTVLEPVRCEGSDVGVSRETVASDSDSGVAADIPDCMPGNVIEVSEAEAHTLVGRFGRIYNVGITVPDAEVNLTSGSVAEQLAGARVTLRYSDGSTADRTVNWDPQLTAQLQIEAENGTWRSGETRTIMGNVRQQTYAVPFAKERADPSVFAWDWNGKPMFLFIATDDTGGNCIDPHDGATHMPLRVGRTIAELSDEAGGRAREIDLLRCGDRNSEGKVMTGCFWAPELHVIGGRLSILFMPCFDGPATVLDGSASDRAGKPDMWTGSCHIMQLGQDDNGRDLDPREPANWSVPEPIKAPGGGVLNPVQSISLDMTVFEDSGCWYYAWQQVGSVWIATFDPGCPAQLTSVPRQIVVPEFAWDNAIAEGPNVIAHDGTLFLIYSGSLVGIDYTTGLVTAPAGAGADLLDPATWSKLDYPLQKSGIYNGAWQLGTGHGMWSHDEDGNLLYVFHAAEYNDGTYGGRDAQVRRVHWAADGMPVLDMQTDEELNPMYHKVLLHVTMRDTREPLHE